MKLRNRNTLNTAFALMLSIVIVGCAEAPKAENNSEETAAEETIVEETEVMEEDLSFMLPSPIQIAAMFNRAGLEYQEGLTNPAENLSNYNTKTAKYLNFGVYSADLAYAVLNNQQQASIDYLNAVKTLSDDIGMPSIFGTGELIEKFEKNIDNQDTILMILTTIKRRTDEYLAENEERSKEAIFFSSAWIEGMYLGANSPADEGKLTARLIEQMTILSDVIKALEVQKDPSLEIDSLVADLKNMLDTFNNFESVKALDDADTDISDVELSSEELDELKTQITDLRTNIVNG